MNQGKTVFSQIIEHMPLHVFRKCVKRYNGNYRVQHFKCFDQFLCMAFAQLTGRESLRDIEACLQSMKSQIYHMGFRCASVSRNTLAKANEQRSWHIYADFAQYLMHQAQQMYENDSFSLNLKETVYALDSSVIKLCLSLCPWAHSQKGAAGVKLHALVNLRGNIPGFAHVTSTKVQDFEILDHIIPEPGSYYVMDRGYIDLSRLHVLHQIGAFFVIRNKINLLTQRRYSHKVDRATGLRYDQTIIFTGRHSSVDYPDALRRVKYYDQETNTYYVFLTNNFVLPALTIANIYKSRWQIELFFKWIKQHLKIKKFFGYSENAIQTQIWIAITVYVLVAIVKKRLHIELDLYTILQIFNVTPFQKIDIYQLLTKTDYKKQNSGSCNQLNLFN